MSYFTELVDDIKCARGDLPNLMLSSAERRLESQFELFKSGDARAAGLLAVSAALSGAGLAVAADAMSDPKAIVIVAAAAAFAVSSTAGSLCAIWALWPCNISAPGFAPQTFRRDTAQGRLESRIHAEVIALLQIRIDRNHCLLVELAWRARLAMIALALAPVTGAVAALVSTGEFGWAFILGLVLAVLVALTLALFRRSVQSERSRLTRWKKPQPKSKAAGTR